VIGRILSTFQEAAKGATDPQDALHRMGTTYPEPIGDRFALLCQLQAYAAAGDPQIREHVARAFQRLADEVRALSGCTPGELAAFLAGGMLANVTTILGMPELCEPLWEHERSGG
jgi:hypothetical protein